MDKKVNFSIASGTWKALKDEEVINVKTYQSGFPMAEITRVKDEEGNESGNQLIASTDDTYILETDITRVFGTRMNLHPFYLVIKDYNQILLIHKETGKEKFYNRLN